MPFRDRLVDGPHESEWTPVLIRGAKLAADIGQHPDLCRREHAVGVPQRVVGIDEDCDWVWRRHDYS
jgi:hypothetical protein